MLCGIIRVRAVNVRAFVVQNHIYISKRHKLTVSQFEAAGTQKPICQVLHSIVLSPQVCTPYSLGPKRYRLDFKTTFGWTAGWKAKILYIKIAHDDSYQASYFRNRFLKNFGKNNLGNMSPTHCSTEQIPLDDI